MQVIFASDMSFIRMNWLEIYLTRQLVFFNYKWITQNFYFHFQRLIPYKMENILFIRQFLLYFIYCKTVRNSVNIFFNSSEKIE